MIQDYGCGREGRKLSWETRAEEVGFEVLPKRWNRGAVSNMKGERVMLMLSNKKYATIVLFVTRA